MNSLCELILLNNYMGQISDNAVRAVGSAVGEGAKLRRLSKINIVLSGVGVPMVTFPNTDIATRHGLFSVRTRAIMNSAFGMVRIFYCSTLEVVSFDSTKMNVADKLSIKRHEGWQLAGTAIVLYFWKSLQCLLPVLALLLYQLGIGALMLISKRGVVAGWLLLFSGFLSVLSSSLNHPDIQMWGERNTLGFVSSILAAAL